MAVFLQEIYLHVSFSMFQRCPAVRSSMGAHKHSIWNLCSDPGILGLLVSCLVKRVNAFRFVV